MRALTLFAVILSSGLAAGVRGQDTPAALPPTVPAATSAPNPRDEPGVQYASAPNLTRDAPGAIAPAAESSLERSFAPGPEPSPPPQPLPTFSIFQDITVLLGGSLTADFLYSSVRPVSPGTPFFLVPDNPDGNQTHTFDILARQSAIFALFKGPDVGDFESGGLVLANFYDNTILADLYGILPIEVFGQLKNDDWRIALGRQLDLFNPRLPTVLPFSMLVGSGNVGLFRGQARVERFLYPAEDSQLTLQACLSEPISTVVSDSFKISEDNGWPNVEGRIMFGLGEVKGEGVLAHRPFEVAVSALVGQIRTVEPGRRVVGSVWGFGADLRWEVTDQFGTKGEFYTGRGLGTYGGAILQNIDALTLDTIPSVGGWLEAWYFWLPEVHTHAGYGIDSADRADLAPGQLSRNDTLFANVIWDVTKRFRLALEGTYRHTDYVALLNNRGFTVHTQAQWKF